MRFKYDVNENMKNVYFIKIGKIKFWYFLKIKHKNFF
jgi:hypothetical protein